MAFWTLFIISLFVPDSVHGIKITGRTGNHANHHNSTRENKFISLFSIVTFQNKQCGGISDSSSTGTCYTSSECMNRGGHADGHCASGFGVCCIATVSSCGSVIQQNDTYIQNPDFPASYRSSPSSICEYTLSPSSPSEICQLKLTFNTLVLSSDANCQTSDKLTIGGSPGNPDIIICDDNSNNHVYVDTGNPAVPISLKLSFSASNAFSRTWKIKVTQIECHNPSRPPSDCRQYFTGFSGNVKSFANFGPSDQTYVVCFRQNSGYCGIDFFENTGVSNPFKLSADAFAAPVTTSLVGSDCIGLPRLAIPNDFSGNFLYCGAKLSSVSGQSVSGVVRQTKAPFFIAVATGGTLVADFGFNLQYSQVPC